MSSEENLEVAQTKAEPEESLSQQIETANGPVKEVKELVKEEDQEKAECKPTKLNLSNDKDCKATEAAKEAETNPETEDSSKEGSEAVPSSCKSEIETQDIKLIKESSKESEPEALDSEIESQESLKSETLEKVRKSVPEDQPPPPICPRKRPNQFPLKLKL